MMKEIGFFLITISFLIFFLGVFLVISSKIPFLGKLPGDILIKKDNFTFFFPITTSILISIILSIIFSILSKK